MTDRERGFLDAVLADPGDDFPRLVYADWLEEEGQVERAEFIRLQCRMEAIRKTCLCGACVKLRGGGQHTNGPCGIDQERDELPGGRSKQAMLRRRERELLAGIGSYTPYVVPDPAIVLDDWNFRRGFVASVSLTLADFLTHAGAIFATAPVEEVRLTDREPLSLSSTRRIPGEPWYGWYAWGDARLRLPHSAPEGAVYSLPPTLFAWLGGRRAGGNPYDRYYPGRDQAVADLCRACVAYGRDKAGLPALPTKEAVSP